MKILSFRKPATIEDVEKKFEDIPYMTLSQARILRDLFKKYKIKNCLELGFFHGKSSCFIASILDENNAGKLTTIDYPSAIEKNPNIHKMLKKLRLSRRVNVLLNSYTWEMMEMLKKKNPPRFDFCYIDGSHTWDSTGFAFFLVDKLLKPGGWILFDDLNYSYRKSADCQRVMKTGEPKPEWLAKKTEEELDALQVRNVWELLVKKHPGYHNFREIKNWGFAQKRK